MPVLLGIKLSEIMDSFVAIAYCNFKLLCSVSFIKDWKKSIDDFFFSNAVLFSSRKLIVSSRPSICSVALCCVRLSFDLWPARTFEFRARGLEQPHRRPMRAALTRSVIRVSSVLYVRIIYHSIYRYCLVNLNLFFHSFYVHLKWFIWNKLNRGFMLFGYCRRIRYQFAEEFVTFGNRFQILML